MGFKRHQSYYLPVLEADCYILSVELRDNDYAWSSLYWIVV